MAGSRKPPQAPPGPSMLSFWEPLLGPLAEALEPKRILEIGSDQGTMTRVLLEYADSHGAVLDSIDPKPNFDVEEMKRKYPESFVPHQTLSLQALPGLDPFELALIDGDHNWYTVLNELRALERSALEAGVSPPVIALHDIGWPYGRRDLYYDPDNIPVESRRDFERRGIHPDSEELVDDGINAHLDNAKESAAQHSGVRGAIDDFLAESKQDWKLFEVTGQHGLGVMATEALLDERSRLKDLLDGTSDPEFLLERIDALERDRIDAEVRGAKAALAAKKLQASIEELRAKSSDTASDELEDAERRLARLKRQRDAADEREAALEDELARERRGTRLAKEDAEVAVERSAREAARLEAVEAELGEARAEKDRLGEAELARTRLIADFEDSRESLEQTIDELRAQADTGHHAAAELRGMLEERELEMQRIVSQVSALHATLGRARAEAEVAQTERAALERRLTDLAARHEAALAELATPGSADAAPASDRPAEDASRGVAATDSDREVTT